MAFQDGMLIFLHLYQAKLKVWEKRLVDETIGSTATELIAQDWEAKYLRSLPFQGRWGGGMRLGGGGKW